MKGLAFISTGIAVLAIILFFYQQSQLTELKKAAGGKEKNVKTDGDHDHHSETEEDFELAHFMTRIQIYHLKLYYSGINNNSELQKFYLHELEEEMEAIIDAKIIDEGVNISKNMEIFGINQLRWFEKELENKSDFKTTFETFTSGSCNGCHQATKHQFIQIKVPEENPFTNQVFE